MNIRIPAEAKIVSFDVFDTILTRTVPEPIDIFVLLAECLTEKGILKQHKLKDGFVRNRMTAERKARRRSQYEEITLCEIYEEFGRRTGVPNDLCRRIATEEVDLETASVRPVPAMVALMNECRSAGRRIVLLSDMYLHKSVIEKMLVAAGIYCADDRLYVSSDLRMTKRSGRLFKHIIKQEKISTTDIFHIGDNPVSDFAVPRRLGIDAWIWRDGAPNRYERLLSAGGADHGYQLIAGASRLARLERDGYPEPTHGLYRIGANVAGPILSGYVTWLLREAISRGIKRLYFVSRDGQILMDIASRLITSLDISPIELRYLYGSRQAWHLPATINLSTDLLDWLILPDPVVTIRILAERLCSDLETVVSLLSVEGFSISTPDSPFATSHVEELRRIISKLGDFYSFILSRAKGTRRDALAYFKQEGMLEDLSWAIVDMGWKGHLQDSLQTILSTGGYDRPIDGFYFGLLTGGTDTNRKYPYFFGPLLPRILMEWGATSISILEVFTAADHGLTTSYHTDGDGMVRPTFKGNGAHIRSWGIDQLRDGIARFILMLDRDRLKLMAQPSYVQYICNILIQLQIDPSLEEAECLGTYPFSSNQAETVLRPLAPPLSFAEALHYLMIFDGNQRFQLTFWLHGSRKRSAWHVNLFLTLCSKLLRRTDSLFQALGMRKIGESA